jgi:hypothetical protein
VISVNVVCFLQDAMHMPNDMRSPLLKAADTPETFDSMVTVVETLRTMYEASTMQSKQQLVHGHVTGIQRLLDDQVDHVRRQLSPPDVEDELKGNQSNKAFRMLAELDILPNQRQEIEPVLKQVLVKQAEFDQLQAELQERREQSAFLHGQIMDLHEQIGAYVLQHALSCFSTLSRICLNVQAQARMMGQQPVVGYSDRSVCCQNAMGSVPEH